MLNHRRKILLKLLSQKRYIATRELPGLLDTSMASARRDVSWLVQNNLATRWHGTIASIEHAAQKTAASYGAFHWNLRQQAAQKRAIAQAAAGMCADGDAIVVGGGTTTLLMADFLAHKRLKILTGSFLLAGKLLHQGLSEVIVQGGTVHREQNVIVSPFEQDLWTYHNSAKTFIGVYAISEAGLIEIGDTLIRSGRRLIEHAGELVVLADSSKFYAATGTLLCGLDQVTTVITDSGAPAEAVRMLERHGVRVIQVTPEEDAHHAH